MVKYRHHTQKKWLELAQKLKNNSKQTRMPLQLNQDKAQAVPKALNQLNQWWSLLKNHNLHQNHFTDKNDNINDFLTIVLIIFKRYISLYFYNLS